MATLYLAYRYVQYHRVRTWLLVAAVTLTIMMPIATRWAIERFRAQALARADATPMILGAKGSRFALTLHALYFRGDPPETIAYRQLIRAREMQFGRVLPILARYQTQGRRIVGVTDEYLVYRRLNLAAGASLERWGDCLVGSQVARDLEIRVGDSLLSEPDNILDLTAPAPLKLRVRGILARTNTSDDEVVFCHLETAWIMAGIGHGHDSLPGESEDVHNAENLQRFSEVTAENLSSFHFHGNRGDFPLTAMIAVPDSPRSAALWEGKYLSPGEECQVVNPAEVVRDLLQMVARIQQLLDLVSLLLGVATCLLLVLVLWLSLRLRQREIATLKLLGASRWKIAQIMCAELTMILVVSCLTALTLSSLLVYNLNVIDWL